MKTYIIGTSQIVCNNKLITYTHYTIPSDNTYVIEKILEDEYWNKSAIVGEYTVLTKIISVE